MVSCNASWVRAPAQCKPRKGKNQPSYSYVLAYATARRIPPLVIASTYGSVGVRALLASCLTDAVRRRAAALAGRIGAEVGSLLGLSAFWLICGSAFHDEAHGALMALS